MQTMLFLCSTLLFAAGTPATDNLAEAIKTAEAFVKLVDKNDAKALKKILHPEMMQFAKLGDQLMPFKGADFIQMVADKKLGGKARSIQLKNVQRVRGGTIDIVLQAVSDEYDFMYQISLAQADNKWLILTVMADVQPAG